MPESTSPPVPYIDDLDDVPRLPMAKTVAELDPNPPIAPARCWVQVGQHFYVFDTETGWQREGATP